MKEIVPFSEAHSIVFHKRKQQPLPPKEIPANSCWTTLKRGNCSPAGKIKKATSLYPSQLFKN